MVHMLAAIVEPVQNSVGIRGMNAGMRGGLKVRILLAIHKQVPATTIIHTDNMATKT